MGLLQRLANAIVVNTLIVVFTSVAFFGALLRMVKLRGKYFHVTPRDVVPTCLRNPQLGDHAYIKLSKTKLHYVELGDKNKPLLLFVHGFPEFWYSWRHQLQEFAQDYWVVAVDLRGYGNSEKPKGVENYTVPELVKDLKELITGLERQSCIVAAHDWGGILAWYLTLMYPEVVDKLIIMDAPHPAAFMKLIHSSFKQLLMSSYMFLFQVPKLPEMMLRSNDLEAFDRIFATNIYYKDSINSEDIEAYKYTFSEPDAFTPPLNFYRNMMKSLGDQQALRNASKIKVPVLIIWGEKDVALDPKLMEMSATYVENCTTKLIPHVGHWVQQDAYQLVNDYMHEFLNDPNSISRGLAKRMRTMKRHLMTSVSGVMRMGGMIKYQGQLAKSGTIIAASLGSRMLSSSFHALCGISGIPVDAVTYIS